MQHAQIVTGLETFGRNERAALNLVECILKLVSSVRRVDTDHNGADLGCSQLHHDPLDAVGPPDSHAIARLNPQRQKPCGQLIHVLLQHFVGPPDILMPHHQRIRVRMGVAGSIEIVSDGFVDDL